MVSYCTLHLFSCTFLLQGHIFDLADAAIKCSEATKLLITKIKSFPSKFLKTDEFIKINECAEKLLSVSRPAPTVGKKEKETSQGTQDSDSQYWSNPKVLECIEKVLSTVKAKEEYDKSCFPSFDLGLDFDLPEFGTYTSVV